jgi:hypothetical protein
LNGSEVIAGVLLSTLFLSKKYEPYYQNWHTDKYNHTPNDETNTQKHSNNNNCQQCNHGNNRPNLISFHHQQFLSCFLAYLDRLQIIALLENGTYPPGLRVALGDTNGVDSSEIGLLLETGK